MHVRITIKWKKSLDSRLEELKHRKNRNSCHPFPGHSATVLLSRREENHIFPGQGGLNLSDFYDLTVAEVNTCIWHRDGWVSNVRCHLSHRTWVSLPAALPAHWLQRPHRHSGSREHHWTPTFPKQGTCHREEGCLKIAYCNIWRLTEP